MTLYVSLSSAFGVRLYNICCHKAMMDCQPPRGAVWGQHVADAKRRELFSLLIIVSSNHVHIKYNIVSSILLDFSIVHVYVVTILEYARKHCVFTPHTNGRISVTGEGS